MASGPNSRGDGLEARGDGVERFVPGDALEAAFALGADAPLRIEQAVGANIRAPGIAPLCRTGIRA